MTINEYKAALKAMSDNEFKRFCADFGGDFESRDRYVREFVDHPQHERRLCQLLGLKTEHEKQTDAAVTSAASAKDSARWACWSIVVAGVSMLISIIALFIGVCKS